jgi:MFS family permease
MTDLVVPGLAGFAVGGLIYGPFTAICTALFQRTSPPHALSRVLATRTALTIPCTALGTLLGGPLVTAIGARHTLLLSALLTIALGASVGAVLALNRARAGRRRRELPLSSSRSELANRRHRLELDRPRVRHPHPDGNSLLGDELDHEAIQRR